MLNERLCPACDQPILTTNPRAIYCSRACCDRIAARRVRERATGKPVRPRAAPIDETYLRHAYLELGLGSPAIGAALGCNRATVRNYLHRYNIPLRPIGTGSPATRKYTPINVTGFTNLQDDWHAYWVGFLAADGSVQRTHVAVKLAAVDYDHLVKLRDGLGSNLPVKRIPNGGQPAASLTLSGAPLLTALAQWGVVPNKTLSLSFPTYLPPALLPAYIRGYFDGDGTLMQRVRAGRVETVVRFTCGNQSFLQALQQALSGYGVRTLTPYTNRGSNAHVLPVACEKANLRRFLALLYQGATVALDRKVAIARSIWGEGEPWPMLWR